MDKLKTDWSKFPEEAPAESGTYDVVIAHDNGAHVETAEYSNSHNGFLWYSRRGYPFKINGVTHWRHLPDLPLTEKENDTIS